MKRLLIALTILFAAAGSQAAEKLTVVTTTTDLAWIMQQVGGDKVEVESIARGYQDPHFVEAKPSFLLRLRKADLLAVVGLDLEIGWLSPLIEQSRNARIRPGNPGYLDVSAGVEIADRPQASVNRSMGDVHAKGNPHYWLDPANAVRIGIQMERRLSELRPQDTKYFQTRLNELKGKMNKAHQRWTAMLAPYRGAKVVTYHRSWTNFVNRYGLDVVEFVEPKPGVPPSPAHIFELIQKMKAEGVKVILVEPYFDLKTPNSVAAKTGAKVLVMYPSVGGAEGLDDYYAVFDRNIGELVKALR